MCSIWHVLSLAGAKFANEYICYQNCYSDNYKSVPGADKNYLWVESALKQLKATKEKVQK